MIFEPPAQRPTPQTWHSTTMAPITRAKGHTRCVSAYIIREKNEENERNCSGKARRVRQNLGKSQKDRTALTDEDLRAFTTLCWSGRHACILCLRSGVRRRRTGNISTSVTTPSTFSQRNVMFSEQCRMCRDGAAQRQPTAPGLWSV